MNQRPPSTKYQPPNKAYFLAVDEADAPRGGTGNKKRRGRARRALGTIALALTALLVVGFVVVVLTLPGCARRQLIAAAASRGVTLGIGDVRLRSSGFTLVDVTASAAELPGVTATAPIVEVDMRLTDVQRLTAENPEIAITASFESTKLAFAEWQRAHLPPPPRAGEGAMPPGIPFPRLVVDGAHLVWTKPFGDGSVEALALHAEITDQGTYDEVHVAAPRITAALPAGNVGPWRADYDRDDKTSRLRVAFDPEVPEGANALFVGDGTTITSADVNIPRSPLAHLGVDPAALGLPRADATQLEAKISYRHLAPSAAETRATMGLYGIKLGRLPLPLSAALELAASGDPASQLDVHKGTLTVGPLKGAVVGTEKIFDGGFRIDLGWRAGPTPCAAFLDVQGEAGQEDTVTQIRRQLGQLAAATGLAKVDGEIEVDAALTLDTRELELTKLSIVEPKRCGL